MSSVETLSELTASLVQELARSAATADRSQRDEWVALAAEASVPLEQYCARAADKAHVGQVMTQLAGAKQKLRIPAARLRALFGDRWKGVRFVAWEEVEEAVVEKLRSDAAARHAEISAALRARLPKVELSRGAIDAKVLLRTSRDGTVIARLATPDIRPGARDVVSTLRVEFNVGAFPAFEANGQFDR